MKLDAILPVDDLAAVAGAARELEAAGFDGAWTAEVGHDPFLPHAVAAVATERIQLGTSIAVAFARSPMTIAYTAHDLQAASHGRFILGLGSQIKAHITRRFSMPWGKPAAQMREYILALRAIWASWDEGRPLDFQGEYYRHTLMTAMFRPPPSPHGPPRVFLAAVGTAMTRVAGEVSDGLVVHGFTTERYLREVTLPALAVGTDRAGRTRSDVEVTCPGFVVVDDGTEAFAARLKATRRQIAFYGSTPAYRPVLELHGWSELADRLHALSVTKDESRWAAMGDLIDDDVLAAFAVVGGPTAAAVELKRRYGDIVDRVHLPAAAGLTPAELGTFLSAFR
ncbi:MAG TPA: TIGR03617 family F420-dependent LLM class oxidoreductase [Trebonia sp.]|jgi:probable F420-dependent oxidoreductase|nr:TIGR03617 family F420-dependent LLM class oxidoreductase [Trebonia sp.]